MYLRRKVFSAADNYGYGYDLIDEIYERAFSEGYEYAQREFGIGELTNTQIKELYEGLPVQERNKYTSFTDFYKHLQSAHEFASDQATKRAKQTWENTKDKQALRNEMKNGYQGTTAQLRDLANDSKGMKETKGYRTDRTPKFSKEVKDAQKAVERKNWLKRNKKALAIGGGLAGAAALGGGIYAYNKKD